MRNIIVLTLLGIYPFLVAGMFPIVYYKHKKVEDLQQQLQAIPESDETTEKRIQLKRKYEEQNDQIKKLLSTFYSKTRDFSEADVPALLKKYANQSGLYFEAIESDNKTTRHNCQILPVSLRVSGEFDQLLDFIKQLENSADRFLSLKSFEHQSTTRGYMLKDDWKLELDVLLEGPTKAPATVSASTIQEKNPTDNADNLSLRI